jgi:hypothetical protein
MAKFSSKDVAFFQAGGRNVLSLVTNVALKIMAALEETTALGDAWKAQAATGIKSFDLTLQGFYDDAVGLINEAMIGVGGSQIISLGLGGNVVGGRFIGLEAPLVAEYDRQATINQFHKAPVTYKGNGQVDEGVIVQPRAVQTAGWDTSATPVDNGAASVNGGVGYLQVEAVTLGGYTSWTVKVKHSADNVTYVDLLSFDVVTTAPQAQRKAVAGTINRYLDVSGSLQGSGSGPSLTCSVGVARL